MMNASLVTNLVNCSTWVVWLWIPYAYHHNYALTNEACVPTEKCDLPSNHHCKFVAIDKRAMIRLDPDSRNRSEKGSGNLSYFRLIWDWMKNCFQDTWRRHDYNIFTAAGQPSKFQKVESHYWRRDLFRVWMTHKIVPNYYYLTCDRLYWLHSYCRYRLSTLRLDYSSAFSNSRLYNNARRRNR